MEVSLLQTASRRALAVKRWAGELDFDACGIAAAGPADPGNRLGAWLDAGLQADMDWITRTREIRQDVTKKVPGAKSVIVVARNYYAPRPEQKPGLAKVSRYAWGRDYHRALRKPLKRLAELIRSLEDRAEAYASIDSGPVLERGWAARAGIGWVGKNSLVLRRDIGSWFFLGTIITTVELVPDEPVTDQCGTCTLCIDSCPTGAILDDRTVDSRRCISYHTIENRGEIPAEYHEAMEDWVFGCDICQDVCPWNRFATVTDQPDFHPRPRHANPDPEWLLEMDKPTFDAEFAGTPVRRPKYEGMLRNAAIVRKNVPKDDEN